VSALGIVRTAVLAVVSITTIFCCATDRKGGTAFPIVLYDDRTIHLGQSVKYLEKVGKLKFDDSSEWYCQDFTSNHFFRQLCVGKSSIIGSISLEGPTIESELDYHAAIVSIVHICDSIYGVTSDIRDAQGQPGDSSSVWPTLVWRLPNQKTVRFVFNPDPRPVYYSLTLDSANATGLDRLPVSSKFTRNNLGL
jgi:hypothetical protein